MQYYRTIALYLFMSNIVFYNAVSQDSVLISSMKQIPEGYIQEVRKKVVHVGLNVERKSSKMLRDFEKQELELKRQLLRVDSNMALTIFQSAGQQLNGLKQKLNIPQQLNKYYPDLDSIKTSLKFLGEYSFLLKDQSIVNQQINLGLNEITALESKLQCAEMIREFIKERKQQLQEQLGRLGYLKQLNKLNKHYHYYSQQINAYKEILKDRKKAERKALALLSNTRPFKDFMKKNSMLSQLFRIPGGNGSELDYSQYLAGLQTRNTVTQLIQQQTGFNGINAQQQFQQNVQQGISQMQILKDKVNALGNKYDAQDLPDFRPDDVRTKTFLKRLELGSNFQFQKSNSLVPKSLDVGLSLGYKLTEKSVVGIGFAYQLGWGKDIRHIKFEHKGIGLRSFIDWKIKGGIWLSGGYELNYISLITKLDQLKDFNAWQHSGLIGISKKFSFKSGLVKGSKVQILWDLMSYRQLPRTQPFLVRYGFNFQ